MSKMRRYSPSVACSSGPFHSTPALLNATSRRPNLSTVKSTIFFTSPSLATSARTNAASPPSFLISATTCAPSFSRRPVNTTFAPARANAIAVAFPIPEVPPVTSATFPVNPLFISFSLCPNLFVHCEHDAEAYLAAVHVFVSFARSAEGEFFDHRMHAAERAEFQSVLRIACGPGIPAVHLPSSHDQRQHADCERIVRCSRNQQVTVHSEPFHDRGNRFCARRCCQNHPRAAKLLQLLHRIDTLRIEVMMRAKFLRKRLLIFPATKCDCLESHLARILDTKVSEPADSLHRNDIARSRT